MLPYYICTLFLVTQVVGRPTLSVEDQAQTYGKRIHPPLVRMIRSLEDELRNLPNENSPSTLSGENDDQEFPSASTESSDAHFENHAGEVSKPAPVYALNENINEGNRDFISNPAATEFLPASTPTPQLPEPEKTVSPSPFPVHEAANAKDNGDGSDEDDGSDDEVDDDEDDDDDKDAEDDRAIGKKSTSTVAPAYVKDAYFLAREDKGEDKASKVAHEAEKQDGRPTAVDDSDLSLERDIDRALTEYERREVKKLDGDKNESNNNNNNNNNNDNNNRNKSAESELAILKSNRNSEESSTNEAATERNVDQYNYEANGDESSLEIDITDDEQVDAADEGALENTENYYEGAGDSDNSSATANWDSASIVTPENDKVKLEREIIERLQSVGMDSKRLVKKSMMMRHSPHFDKARNDGATEDILQLMIKVAEDPKDWEEIRELLEKIEFDETTLRKAKSRLRALAKQQKIKNRKNNRTKDPNRHAQKLTKMLSRDLENEVVQKPPSRLRLPSPLRMPSAPATGRSKGVNKTKGVQRPAASRQGNPETLAKGAPSYIKVSVFPAHKSATKGKFRGGNSPSSAASLSKDEDFAIERPVTVIGERSRVDPVEKQLVEASTNQRLREIQREKARLAAAGQPTDEMEEQLKALTKLERRLKDHWRQKQKLLQKIHEKEERRRPASSPRQTNW